VTRRTVLFLAASSTACALPAEYHLARAALWAETAPGRTMQELAALGKVEGAAKKWADAIAASVRWRNDYVQLNRLDLSRLSADERREIESLRLTLEAAYDFELPDASGLPVRLQKLRGRVVLLNFFATWCAPCRQELPALESIHAEGRCTLYAITAETIAETAAFREKTRLRVPVLHDPARGVVEHFSVRSYPATIVINAKGHPAGRLDDIQSEAAFREAIIKATV